MHNLGIVLWFEFKRTVKRKAFWVSTLIVPALIALVFVISYFSDKSASTVSDQLAAQKFSMMVLDDSKLILPSVLRAAHAQTVQSKAAGIAAVQQGRVDAFFYYPANPAKEPVQIYGQDVGLVKSSKYTAVAGQLLQVSIESRLGSSDDVALVTGSINTTLTTYENGRVTQGVERVVAPALYLILFYAVIILLGNQMLSSTTEEKENRVIEMILTTVSSRALIVGKILAMALLGIVQVLAIATPTVVAYMFFRSHLSLPNVDLTKLAFDPVQMLVGALLFIGGFLLFTGLLVAIGAAMPTAKESNRFFGVAMFGMFVPLYAAGVIVTDPTQLIVKVFSFFPLTAPITLMLRNAVGNLSTGEAVLGIAIVLVSSALALGIAIRSFRYGTLQYSRRLTWREVLGRSH